MVTTLPVLPLNLLLLSHNLFTLPFSCLISFVTFVSYLCISLLIIACTFFFCLMYSSVFSFWSSASEQFLFALLSFCRFLISSLICSVTQGASTLHLPSFNNLLQRLQSSTSCTTNHSIKFFNSYIICSFQIQF